MSGISRKAENGPRKLGAIPRHLSPANYPIGSAKSKLAMKLLLEERRKATGPTEEEQDYLHLYELCKFWGWKYDTYAIQRGREVYERHEKLHGRPESSAELFYGTETAYFFAVHGRDPKPGESISYAEHIRGRAIYEHAHFQIIIQAWNRRMGGFAFPFDKYITDEESRTQRGSDIDRDSKILWQLVQAEIEKREHADIPDIEMFDRIVFGHGVLLPPTASQRNIT